jgi:hypothetical protein
MITLTITCDSSLVCNAMDRAIAQLDNMPPDLAASFRAKWDALNDAGAEWCEAKAHGKGITVDVSDDFRRLCREFGVTV